MRLTHQYHQEMGSATAETPGLDVHKIQQAIKWTVYALLIINYVFYIFEDWGRGIHTLHAGSTLLDWTSEFANSIDITAWLVLLAMFELETYVLEDEDWTGWVGHTVRGARLFCYVLIAHTVYAYAVTVTDYKPTVAVEGVTSLCELVDADVSYVFNLKYNAVNEETCNRLSDASTFYRLGEGPLVSDLAGLELERDLAWVDLIEAVVWLLILLAIEIVVRLQGRGVSGGKVLGVLNGVKAVLYASLFAAAVYWGTLDHWLYVWDELVWILGFWAIEMNVSEWRAELKGGELAASTAGLNLSRTDPERPT